LIDSHRAALISVHPPLRPTLSMSAASAAWP
jgi:hypothetical protein